MTETTFLPGEMRRSTRNLLVIGGALGAVTLALLFFSRHPAVLGLAMVSGGGALVGLAASLVCLVPRWHPTWRAAKRYGDPVAIGREIGREVEGGDAVRIEKVTLTPRWLLNRRLSGSDIVRLDEVIWAYRLDTQHSTNGIKTHKTIEVKIHLRSGNRLKLAVEKEYAARRVLEQIHVKAPWAITGYSAELEEAWKRGRVELVAQVEQRRTAGALALALLLVAPAARAGTNAWTPLGPSGTYVYAVAVAPGNGAKIAAGTASGYARSTDSGASWTNVSTGYQTNAIVFDPTNPSFVFGATGGAIVRSTDGGDTYTPVLTYENTSCLAIDPTSPSVVYAGTIDHVYKSIDRGLTWAPVYTGPGHSFVKAIAVDPSHPETVWTAMTFGGLRKSTNAGASWSAVSGWSATPTRPPSISAIAVHPGSSATVFVLGMDGVYRTTDGGAVWERVTSLSNSGAATHGAIVADPTAPGTIYASGSDGVAFTGDGGATWNKLNGGLTNMDVLALALDPSDHTKLYAGTNGDGVFSMTVGSGGAPSIRVISPNGGEQWVSGSAHPITWTASAFISNVKLEYSTTSLSGGDMVDPRLIAASVPNTGSYLWTVPEALSPVCSVRVSDVAGTTSDMSDAPFSITSCGSIYLGPPFSQSIDAAGGMATVPVNTMSGCPWSATSDVAWIGVTSGATGTGSGSFTYAVAPNLGSARTGTLRAGNGTFSVSQAGGNAGTEVVVFVPIVLDVHGAGTSHYTSELTLTNRSDRDASIGLTYAGAASLGGGGGTARITLPARQQLIESDAIAFLARLGVPLTASGNRGGTLAVAFSGVSSISELGATVRTTTAVSNGQAGLAYPGIAGWKALAGPSYLCGLRENAADRSNVALQNAGASGDVTLRVTVFSGDSPARVALPDVTLLPGGFTQYSGILGANGMTNGYVKVERVGGSAPYYAYGVVNDQANSDGSFIPPQPESTAPVTGLTVPVVVEASVYTSELVVTNWSTRARAMTLTFVSDAVDRADHAASVPLAIDAGAQVILPNVFQYFRDHNTPGIGPPGSGYAGALFVTSADGDLSGIVVGARTSSPGGGGRYGLFYPATPAGAASKDAAWLYGLQQNATNRTNLAIVNTGEVGGDDDLFAIDVYDGATGRLAHTESGITLKAKHWLQVNTVLSAYAPGITDGYACVRRIGGTNPFLTYAVINDGGAPQQRSDDGAFLAASE